MSEDTSKSALPARNVLGGNLEVCSLKPLTGFFRDGSCQACRDDPGMHTVCCLLDERFLQYSLVQGNDLMTPRPEWGFPGLKPGDNWCICADRWLQAHEAGCAPKVRLLSTHECTLARIPLMLLKESAVDVH